MTQTEKIKKFIEQNGLGTSCNDCLKRFEVQTGLKVTYANFRRVYITFNEGKNILQVEPMQDPRFKTIEIQTKHGLPDIEWENVPLEETPTTEHIGKPVLVASLSLQKSNYFLLAVHSKGDKFWPTHNGFTVLEESTGYKRCFTAQSVRLIK